MQARLAQVCPHHHHAFAGEGVVQETLNLSELAGYRTGGTLHVIINNQVGFTTEPHQGRSTTYATDVAKMLQIPIFHVNGEDPEAVAQVVSLAMDFRKEFRRDVVIDLYAYRRWGHNEGDDPSYTNPGLYQAIENHRSVRKIYTERLLRRGDIAPETAEKAIGHYRSKLQEINDAVRAALDPSAQEEVPEDQESKEGFGLAERKVVDTSVERPVLEQILEAMGRCPEGFQIHPKLEKQLAKRIPKFNDAKIDWALAEALGYGSLCLEGHPVRLSGEDSGRGTFSQRHAVLHDNNTSEPFVPLNHIDGDQAPFVVFDSLLSEFGVLGFEYGYSVNRREGLTLWEAQFGDFVNGAQVIIDQFISSAEMKWGQKSGLVMLLPHGFEGQGPEHSSARIERFLQLCAQGNMCVSYPSSPAQYFHLLRRQVHSGNPRPLVVFTPKSLLRNPMAVSAAEDLQSGAFQPVLADPDEDKLSSVRRVLLCAGKVFYDLLSHRRKQEITNVAIVRVEQYYPYPEHELREALERFPDAKDIVWVQEEPRNMGAWDFLDERLLATIEPGQTLRYVGRPSAASPATGSSRRHV
ncbi:MAG: 2-oxoglutarate dehydrogenase E1 component, partial [Myxococcota bacterium]